MYYQVTFLTNKLLASQFLFAQDDIAATAEPYGHIVQTVRQLNRKPLNYFF